MNKKITYFLNKINKIFMFSFLILSISFYFNGDKDTSKFYLCMFAILLSSILVYEYSMKTLNKIKEKRYEK